MWFLYLGGVLLKFFQFAGSTKYHLITYEFFQKLKSQMLAVAIIIILQAPEIRRAALAMVDSIDSNFFL